LVHSDRSPNSSSLRPRKTNEGPLCFLFAQIDIIFFISIVQVPQVKEGEEPSREVINEYHHKFVQEIVDLFERYKGAYGWAHKKLVIK